MHRCTTGLIVLAAAALLPASSSFAQQTSPSRAERTLDWREYDFGRAVDHRTWDDRFWREHDAVEDTWSNRSSSSEGGPWYDDDPLYADQDNPYGVGDDVYDDKWDEGLFDMGEYDAPWRTDYSDERNPYGIGDDVFDDKWDEGLFDMGEYDAPWQDDGVYAGSRYTTDYRSYDGVEQGSNAWFTW